MSSGERKRAHDDESSSSSGDSSKKSAPPTNNVAKNIPLSYEALKVLLQNMDANKRFEFATAIPSIRKINAMVPLKIDKLTFGEHCMTVNGTKYQLGIYREFPKGHNDMGIHYIELDNKAGGTAYDLDPHGFRDKFADAVMTPGDVRFEDPEEPPGEKTLEEYQTRLEALRKSLRDRGRGPVLRNPIYDEFNEEYLLKYRVKGVLPPYSSYIQLTITKPGDEKTIQRYPYNVKLYQAFKKLTTIFFGDTSKMINVKSLDLEESQVTWDLRPIRLPPGLLLTVDKLILGGNLPNSLTKLTPILHPSTFPLRCLHVNINKDLDHPIIANNLEKLVTDQAFSSNCKNFHKNTHVLVWDYLELDDLIRDWIEGKQEIGYSVTIYFDYEDEVSEVFNEIKEKDFKFRIQEDRELFICATRISEIKLRVQEPDPNADENEDKWSIRIEMVAI